MNPRERDIENVKEWLRNMEQRMKKYTIQLMDLPEGDNKRSLWDALLKGRWLKAFWNWGGMCFQIEIHWLSSKKNEDKFIPNGIANLK